MQAAAQKVHGGQLPREFSFQKASGLTRGRIKLDPCNLPIVTRDAGCGKCEVFEDRVAKSGRKIALNIFVLPAISAKPAADPIFVLAGGPGQGAVSVVKVLGDYLIKLRRERDIVFVDQRGTGESNPLNCNLAASRDEKTATALFQTCGRSSKS